MSNIVAQNATHTLLGLSAQISGVITPLTPNYYPDYTINNKRGISNTDVLPENTRPTVQYFGLGIGGRNLIPGANASIFAVRPVVPSAENQDLYRPIPIRVVPLSDDLSSEERALYRIRTVETIGEVDYAVYWLKTLVKDPGGVRFSKIGVSGAVETYTFSPHLDPVPPTTSQTGVISSSVNRISVGFTTTCKIDTQGELDDMVKAYIEANPTFYGANPDFILSEIGIYHGVDASNTVGGVTYTEAFGAQLATHICYQGLPWPTVNAPLQEKILLQHGSALLA